MILCVHRGKLSEGIDFSDSLARAVITVGIPYPSVKDVRVGEKKSWNDRFSLSKVSLYDKMFTFLGFIDGKSLV